MAPRGAPILIEFLRTILFELLFDSFGLYRFVMPVPSPCPSRKREGWWGSTGSRGRVMRFHWPLAGGWWGSTGLAREGWWGSTGLSREGDEVPPASRGFHRPLAEEDDGAELSSVPTGRPHSRSQATAMRRTRKAAWVNPRRPRRRRGTSEDEPPQRASRRSPRNSSRRRPRTSAETRRASRSGSVTTREKACGFMMTTFGRARCGVDSRYASSLQSGQE